jgi:predicted phage terminase large subunit-like protein
MRYWDKAGTEGGGAYSAGVKMEKTKDNQFYITDVERGQWSAWKREEKIKQCAELDGKEVKVWVEQEPGSGGKESAESTVRNLSGFLVYTDRVTGSKEVRAEPYAVQVEAGNVYVLNKPWTKDFLLEHEKFPTGKYRDQVDAAGGAFNKLAALKQAGVW